MLSWVDVFALSNNGMKGGEVRTISPLSLLLDKFLILSFLESSMAVSVVSTCAVESLAWLVAGDLLWEWRRPVHSLAEALSVQWSVPVQS